MIPDRNACGEAPPKEWWDEQHGRATSAQYRQWANAEKPAKKKRSKFNANRGYRADLGHFCESSLEANAERWLRFIGFCQWTEKADPPTEGRWIRYEGEEYLLTTKRGRVVGYTPDFHLWQDGRHTLIECKGVMDDRSKKKLSLMAKTHPELPVDLITYEELEARKAEALYAARRRGERVLDIEGWEK